MTNEPAYPPNTATLNGLFGGCVVLMLHSNRAGERSASGGGGADRDNVQRGIWTLVPKPKFGFFCMHIFNPRATYKQPRRRYH
jgi:hypothetical protein